MLLSLQAGQAYACKASWKNNCGSSKYIVFSMRSSLQLADLLHRPLLFSLLLSTEHPGGHMC